MFPVMKAISNCVLFMVAFIQMFDFIFTSISLNDFLGTGKTFRWAPMEAYNHVYNMPSPSATNVYDNEEYHYQDALTKWGYRIIEQIGTSPDSYLWASIGYFDSSRDEKMDMCNYFKGNYIDVSPTKARFMSMKEKLTLIRPVATEDHQIKSEWDPDALTLTSMDNALEAGYYGSRRAIELRMTSRIDFDNYYETKRQQESDGSWPGYMKVTKPLKAVRFYGKSFCDGCQPIAELGQMFCELECIVKEGKNDSLFNVEVTDSHRRHGTQHRMGVSFPATNSAVVETILRISLMLYIVHVTINLLTNTLVSNEERYFRLKKQNADITILLSSAVNRPFISELLLPQKNNISSKPFSLTFFMYNSDFVVFINFIVVCLSFMTSMQLKHEIVWWAYHHETFRAVITRIAVNAKMMWLYLACMKFYKHTIIRLFPKGNWTPYTLIHSHLFVWFWIIFLSFMTFSGFDFLLDPMFKDRIDIINNYEMMNDISVRFQYGFYFIRIPSIIVHTLFVSAIGFVLLIGFQEASGTSKRDNSLFCLMANGSSMLVFDPLHFQNDVMKQTSLIPLSTLMNLKWFMKTQCLKYNHPHKKFGLFSGSPIKFDDNDGYPLKDKGNKDDGKDTGENCEITTICGVDGKLHFLDRATGMDIEESNKFYNLVESRFHMRII